MAGAGYKLYATGDILTAAQVNTYLQEQTVMVFADAATRTTALASVLAEGMISYLKDTDATQYYSGSAWVTIGGSASPASAQNFVATQQSTTSTTYTALTTAQAVTITTGTKVMVIVGAGIQVGTAEERGFMSYAISGATTSAASDDYSVSVCSSTAFDNDQASYVSFRTVTAGSNTFTAQFRSTASASMEARNRQLLVIDLGS